MNINKKGRNLISKILKSNSKEFNRIDREDYRIIELEKVINKIISNFYKTGKASYVIKNSDSIDHTTIEVLVSKEYIIG